MIERPTWQLGDQELPASLPAARVDPREAIETALAYRIGRERMDETTDFVEHAMAFHLQAAKDAYTDLAVLISRGRAAPVPGWSLEPLSSAIPGATEFLLANENGPGGYHVSLRTRPVYTEMAERHVAGLRERIREELETQGLTPHQIMMRDILGPADPTTSETELAAFRSSTGNYRGVAAGDSVSDLIVTALDIEGPPPGVRPGNVSRRSQVEGRDVGEVYLAGLQINSGPCENGPEEGLLNERSGTRISGSTELALALMSRLLVANGLANRIADGAHDLGQKSWKSYGMLHDAEVMDAAHAAVYGACGLINQDVLAQITAFSRGLAEHDIALHAGDFRTLAETLMAEGHGSAEESFDANDMRDQGHAQRDGEILRLFTATQHGTYRLDMDFAGTNAPQRLEAVRVDTAPEIPVGRFVAEGADWQHDYEGIFTGREPIPHDIGRIRAMNNMINSLASLSCVLEDEIRHRDDTPEP